MSKWQVVELELFLKVLLLLEVTLIISVRPKREKLVSAEYRIFGHFHRIFGRIFGRIIAQKLTIFDHNFGQNCSQFKMGKS